MDLAFGLCEQEGAIRMRFLGHASNVEGNKVTIIDTVSHLTCFLLVKSLFLKNNIVYFFFF